jgi:hypothetical protein
MIFKTITNTKIMTELDDLFKSISDLRDEHNDKGEFNAFHAIGFKKQEVMHSKFIATLLDPKSQHGKKNQFLESFITQIGIQDFSLENILICTEKKAERRSIDITIENSDSIIIIENKVWAEDQLHQLEDYYKYCITIYKKVKVVYLTPYGHFPSNQSLGETLKKEMVKCISYEKDIIPWIEECTKQADGRLQYSLQMYIEVLRVLINRDKYMNEIFNYLKDKEKLKLAININSALQGRNYITEFPETIEFLKDRIENLFEDSNPYPDDSCPIPNISIESKQNPELENLRFCFDEGEVYITNFVNGFHITLFHPSNINNEKLRSLIFKDAVSADDWLSKLFEDMRKIK